MMDHEEFEKEETTRTDIEELRREMTEIKHLLQEVIDSRPSEKERENHSDQPQPAAPRPRDFTFRAIQNADRVYTAPSKNQQSKRSVSRNSEEHHLQQRVKPKKKEP
ncbi:hypothetical protein [Salibacterium lacus]|uniref:Uncharacterized protein n=1 Tax=Salibacterium lacus TaxID=1898109 RepID=A0ABW5T386_9BACI